MQPLPCRPITRLLRAFAILVALVFSSCADRIKTDLVAFKALDEGLESSNNTVYNETETILAALKDKTTDPKFRDKSEYWLARAQPIQKLSSEMLEYIEGLRSELKKNAGLNNGSHSFREGDKNAVTHLVNRE